MVAFAAIYVYRDDKSMGTHSIKIYWSRFGRQECVLENLLVESFVMEFLVQESSLDPQVIHRSTHSSTPKRHPSNRL